MHGGALFGAERQPPRLSLLGRRPSESVGRRTDGGRTLSANRAEQRAQAWRESGGEPLGRFRVLVFRQKIDARVLSARHQGLAKKITRFFAEEDTEG